MEQSEVELWIDWHEVANHVRDEAQQVVRKTLLMLRHEDYSRMTQLLADMVEITANARQKVAERDFALTMAKRLYEAPGSNADQRRLAKYEKFKDNEEDLHNAQMELAYIEATLELVRIAHNYVQKVMKP